MDLKPCGDCEKQISPRATHCPYCGAPGYTGLSHQVRVTDLDIGMANMIGLLVKAAIAVIPAAMILAAVGVAIYMAVELLILKH